MSSPLLSTSPSLSSHLNSLIAAHTPTFEVYENIYKTIHAAPELGKQETNTAELVTRHLQQFKLPSGELAFPEGTIHTAIGGHGVAAVLRNRSTNPSVTSHPWTILLRADMDALPVAESTGLVYASHATATLADGTTVPAAHACGHDMHVAALLACAELLISASMVWSGTIVFVFQPDEETGGGASSMVQDGLYNLIPTPVVALALHVNNGPAGYLAATPGPGPAMAACEAFDITVRGKGGHASNPQRSVDPVVVAAYIIVRLQGVVSRMVSPLEVGTINVGAVHGGTAGNVVPDVVELKVNVRASTNATLERLVRAMKTVVEGECKVAGAQAEVRSTGKFPTVVNDEVWTGRILDAFRGFFGEEKVRGSTDSTQYFNAKREGKLDSIPGNHSPAFAPLVQPTLRAAAQSLALAALRALKG
ncbi:hypothetical protein MRB53_037535 [Persea americana]|nr:hypothetical protein MRB53_037535 [Persea americana]